MTWRMSDILMRARLVDELQLRSATARQSQWGGRLAKHVVEMGFTTEVAVTEALAHALSMQRVELGSMPRDAAALAKLDVQVAEEKGIFPYALRDNGKTLWLAMADPCDLEAVDFIAARTGCRIRTAVAGEKEIQVAILRHYKGQEPPASMLGDSPRPVGRSPTGDMVMTDIHGKELDVEAARPTPAPAPLRPQMRLTPVPPPPAATGTGPELERLQGELDKATRVLRALIELCIQKQVFSNDEIRTVIAKSAK